MSGGSYQCQADGCPLRVRPEASGVILSSDVGCACLSNRPVEELAEIRCSWRWEEVPWPAICQRGCEVLISAPFLLTPLNTTAALHSTVIVHIKLNTSTRQH